jgi:hypothetical protein
LTGAGAIDESQVNVSPLSSLFLPIEATDHPSWGKVVDYEIAELARGVSGEKRDHVTGTPQALEGRALRHLCARRKDKPNVVDFAHDQDTKA